MSEKNPISPESQAFQPQSNNQGYSFQPQPAVTQNYGFQNPPANQGGFQPPPTYDQSFPAQGQSQNFYPTQQPGQVVTVISTTNFGPDPTTFTCPSCRHLITTRIDHESSSKTHLVALVLCLIVWPCFWIPYAVDSCKDANHYCPSCGAYLGTYRS